MASEADNTEGDIKVLIGGGGSIGIAVTTALASAPKVGVRVVASNAESAEVIRSQGMHRCGVLGDASVEPDSLEAFCGIRDLPPGPVDQILVMVKAPDIPNVIVGLRARPDLIGQDTIIILFQNGVGFERPLLGIVAPEKIYRAIVSFGAHRKAPNTVDIPVNFGGIEIGPMREGAPIGPAEQLARELREGGIPANANSEISKVVSEKLLFNCCVNAPGAVFHRTLGGLVDAPDSHLMIDCVMEEAWCAIHGEGLCTRFRTLDQYRDRFYTCLIPRSREHTSSMSQDLRSGRSTEVDFLNGQICAMARRQGWSAGLNQFLTNSIHVMERSNQFCLSPLLHVA